MVGFSTSTTCALLLLLILFYLPTVAISLSFNYSTFCSADQNAIKIEVVSDPHDTYDHIGIDISSLRSVRTLTLPSFELTDNLTGDIKYDNVSSILSVTVWLGNDNQGHLRNRSYSLSSKIDLKSALPEQVSVGISASMSNAIELHQIHSWSFSSSLEPPPPAKSSPSRPGPGVIAGEAAGATMFLVLLFAAKEALVVCRRRRQKIMEMEEYYTESEGKVDPMTEIEMGTWPRSFPYHKLVEATREELCRGAETWARWLWHRIPRLSLLGFLLP
ncbi:hypothetical protein ZWY2020_011552 [Hordeum vulgare]|nr:hypothetical protein ZWY2020_011552 [Hordeum vulgare]